MPSNAWFTPSPKPDIYWRDGDIYFWRYRDEQGELKYWCRARKAIIVGGVLRDIYWAYIEGHKVSFHSDGEQWTRDQAENNLLLEFKGNWDEFDVIPGYNEPLYDDADILDLRHANTSQKQIYLRKGAVRSKDSMLEHLRHQREKAESELRSATRNIERLDKTEAEILAGADLNTILI